jgi:hypothetical protein
MQGMRERYYSPPHSLFIKANKIIGFFVYLATQSCCINYPAIKCQAATLVTVLPRAKPQKKNKSDLILSSA